MTHSFFEKIDSTKPVLICIHCMIDPNALLYIYHSANGNITCVCNTEHEVSDFRWAHASHINEKLPNTTALIDLPADHVAMLYFDNGPKWVVEPLIDNNKSD